MHCCFAPFITGCKPSFIAYSVIKYTLAYTIIKCSHCFFIPPITGCFDMCFDLPVHRCGHTLGQTALRMKLFPLLFGNVVLQLVRMLQQPRPYRSGFRFRTFVPEVTLDHMGCNFGHLYFECLIAEVGPMPEVPHSIIKLTASPCLNFLRLHHIFHSLPTNSHSSSTHLSFFHKSSIHLQCTFHSLFYSSSINLPDIFSFSTNPPLIFHSPSIHFPSNLHPPPTHLRSTHPTFPHHNNAFRNWLTARNT